MYLLLKLLHVVAALGLVTGLEAVAGAGSHPSCGKRSTIAACGEHARWRRG
jgi:hypothetical protein